VPLSKYEQKIKQYYEEIQQVLESVNKQMSSEEKDAELIKSIRELGRLPRRKTK
jgi:septation ring formation regulator EzrA